ncbi:hypothetical protein C8Q73DRAFT_781988 [Cubamyces lactineus]|nr:hypothetical protein C8Q73DRAFT_781988 [Cubamyces lactineus]
MTTIDAALLELKWPILSEYTNVKSPTQQRALSNLEATLYPEFGRVRYCATLPIEQDAVAGAKLRAWLNKPYNRKSDIAWELAGQGFSPRDETHLREWLMKQVQVLLFNAPDITRNVWPIYPGCSQHMEFGMYKMSNQAMEYDIAPAMIEEWPNVTRNVVYCPIEVKVEEMLEKNQDKILGWLREGQIFHPEMPDSKTLNAGIAMFVQMYAQLKTSGAPAGILTGSNTVYMCQLEGTTMLIKGPMYRYYEAPAGQEYLMFTPYQMFCTIVTCFYVMGARHLSNAPASAVPRLHFQERTRESWWVQAKRGWDEYVLIASDKLYLNLPGQKTHVLHRQWPSGKAFNGAVVSTLAGRAALHLARAKGLTARIVATELLWETSRTVVWRGTCGSMTVVVKTDRKGQSDTTSVVNREYAALAQCLPKDPAVASALPIPDYYGMFCTVRMGEPWRACIMSDGGPSLEELGELGVQLRAAHERAIRVLGEAGLEATDIRPRNAVYDGQTVRVIDFVDDQI